MRLLSLTTTAHGAPVYPDELGVRYVYDTNRTGRPVHPNAKGFRRLTGCG